MPTAADADTFAVTLADTVWVTECEPAGKSHRVANCESVENCGS